MVPNYTLPSFAVAANMLQYCNGSPETPSNLLGTLGISGTDSMNELLSELGDLSLDRIAEKSRTARSSWKLRIRCALPIDGILHESPGARALKKVYISPNI